MRFLLRPAVEHQSQHVRAAASKLGTAQEATLRARLEAEMREKSAQFAQHSATLGELTADSSVDTTGRARALAALHLYGARAAIEEIDDALVRLDDGRYGNCQSCHQPIPFERLEAIPQARCCAICPAPASPTAGRVAAPRLGSSRNDREEPRQTTHPQRDLDQRGSHTSWR